MTRRVKERKMDTKKNGILSVNTQFLRFILDAFTSEFLNYLVKNYLVGVGDRFIRKESRNNLIFFTFNKRSYLFGN